MLLSPSALSRRHFVSKLTVLTSSMVCGVGPTRTFRVGTESSRPVAGAVVEHVVAVTRAARAETNGAVVADFKGESHEKVGDDLIVECCGRRCPMHVRAEIVVVGDSWRYRKFYELFVYLLTGFLDG